MKKIVTQMIGIASLAACAAVLCTGCRQYVSKSDYDNVVQQYEALRLKTAETEENYMQQTEAMDQILSDLSEISGRTNSLRINVENGYARLTQAEQIEESIAGIKERLNQLDKLTRDNASYRKVVANLKKVVTEKEEEIESLKKEILAKDRTIKEQKATISSQSGTIESQKETISDQEDRLRQAVREQAKLLYDAGADFEALGDSSPEIRRRRDRAKVQNLTLEMYEKALLYYEKARETGYTGPDRISIVEDKIAGTAAQKK